MKYSNLAIVIFLILSVMYGSLQLNEGLIHAVTLTTFIIFAVDMSLNVVKEYEKEKGKLK